MMARRLLWVGLAALAVGALASFALRLTLPPSVLTFGFQVDPAVLLLVVALLVALASFLSGLLLRWRRRSVDEALAFQAAARERDRRRFIQRLDHELKNPLTAIQIQLDNLQEVEGPRNAVVAALRAQADRLSLLTRGLRRLADLETRPLELEQIDVGELMDEVVELLQAPERIQLDVQRAPWPVPPIDGDRELLLLAFRNVVANALAYSSDPVQVRVAHTSGHLVVEVIDTGRGVHPDDLPHVTEELFRGGNVHEVPGSGLGLSIVDRIVERHRGSLELRSRLDQGTIVTIQLPYDQMERA